MSTHPAADIVTPKLPFSLVWEAHACLPLLPGQDMSPLERYRDAGFHHVSVNVGMDMTPTVLILTPVLMPVVNAAGIDPVYFGVLFIMNNAIGLVTPPVGTVLNVVAGVGRMSMDRITMGVMPFMIAQFGLLLLLVFCPWLVTVPARWFGG